MLDLPAEQLSVVRIILRHRLPSVKAYAFGSRVTGRARKFSDLDLLLDGGAPIDRRVLAEVKEDFVDSDLPIKVDVLDLHRVSDAFKRIILAQRVPLD